MKLSKEMLDSVSAVVDDINNLLRKSASPLKKDEPGEEEKEPEQMSEAPEQESAESAPAEAAEGESAEQAQDQDSETSSEEQMSLAQHAKAMSDEELHSMLEVLMQELEARHGQEQQEGAPQEEQTPPAQDAPAPEMDKSEYAKMTKSLSEAVAAMNSLTAKVDQTLTKSQPAPSKPVVTNSKPLAMGRAEGLAKSQPKAQRLTKSETTEFLLNKMREGNRLVSSDEIGHLSLLKTEEQLHQFQDSLTKRGLDFPKL